MGTSLFHCPYCGVKLQKPGYDELSRCPNCDQWTAEHSYSWCLTISFRTLKAELTRWYNGRHCINCDTGYVPALDTPEQYLEVKHSLECPCTASLEELFLIALDIPYNPLTILQGVKLWVKGYDGELIPLMDKTVEIWGEGTARKDRWKDTFTIVENDITLSKDNLIVISNNGDVIWEKKYEEV